MKRALVLLSMVGLGFLFSWAVSEDSSQRQARMESLETELQTLKPDLEKTESERSAFEAKFNLSEKECIKLQQQVRELSDSRDSLKKQVEELTFSREQSRQQLEEIIEVRDKARKQATELTVARNELLEQLRDLNASQNQLRWQVVALTKSRDAAIANTKTAQERVEILLALVDSETKKFQGWRQQNNIVVTNQVKKNPRPPVVRANEKTNTPPKILRPAVVRSETLKRPVCDSFSTTRSQILPGQSSTLSWQVSNAEKVIIEPGIGAVSALGSRVVKPAKTTVYTLVATNKAGENRTTCKVYVGDKTTVVHRPVEKPAVIPGIIKPAVVEREVNKPPAEKIKVIEPVVKSDKPDQLDGRPVCDSFNTTRPRIMPGQSSMLSWQVSNAERIRIEPGIGVVSALGSRVVKPAESTTYTLIASNQEGQSILSCRIEISERITVSDPDAIHPRVLLDEYETTGSSKVSPEQKSQENDTDTSLGKFLGYRARKDESGKFIFIPIYENKQDKNEK